MMKWPSFNLKVRPLTRICVVSALLFSPMTFAKSNGWKPATATQELNEIEVDINLIRSNYEVRGKVLGQADAEERFNEALTKYLLGDYKKAAEAFYVLLETESVYGSGFVQEAEWYLVDSAFRIGQYALVEEFAKQISNNPGHMFFTDAIRLLLESHGRRGRSDKFREDYRRFVLSGYVESSDALNYAIGKSLYFQGDTPQAKQALFEIQQGSPFWNRAQYFLGGIYVFEKNLEKASQSFDMAFNPEAVKPEEIELNELSLLAKARVLGEQERFAEAISYYEQVPYSSPYFFDRLYETAWAFIEQEQWQEAIDVIQTFLLAYPENENAIRFRNTLGDLYMQVQNYEVALEAYSGVLEQMEPVRERLIQIMTQEPLVLELLDAKLKGKEEPLDYGVPEYIEDRLFKDPELEQTAELVSLAREQREDVTNAQGFVAEIDAVLQNPNRALYSFVKDQARLNNLNQDMLLLLLESLDQEAKILMESSKEQASIKKIQREIAAARADFEGQRLSLEQSRQAVDLETDGVVIALKKIQQDARDVRMMTYALLDELEMFIEENDALIKTLPAHEQQFLLTMIDEVESSMAETQQIVRSVITEDTQRLLVKHLGAERYYRDVIGRLQSDASFTGLQSEALLKEANHFLDDNAIHVQAMPEDQLDELKAQLLEIQQMLKDTNVELQEVASETTRNVLLAKMGYGIDVGNGLDAYLLVFQKIHNQMLPLWSKSTLKDKSVVKQEIDNLWLSARKIDGVRDSVLTSMTGIQDRQRVVLAELLREQESSLSQFADTVVVLAEDAESLGYQAAFRSFENAVSHVDERMLGAELGGVKVTWIRSSNIETEILRLTSEEATRIGALNRRFSILKSKLSDSFSQE